MNKNSNNRQVDGAIIALAKCIDELENVPPEVKAKPYFRSREQLVKDILEGKQ